MKQTVVVSALLLSFICPHIATAGLGKKIATFLVGTQQSENTTSESTQSTSVSDPSIPNDNTVAPSQAPESSQTSQPAMSGEEQQELPKKYSTIDWNPQNIWHQIPQATLPEQVSYWNKVNYHAIMADISILNADKITDENIVKYQHKVDNALRDMLGDVDNIYTQNNTVDNIYKNNTIEQIKMLAPQMKCLADFINKADKLGIATPENTKRAAAWLKKYEACLADVKKEQDKQINQYKQDIDETAKQLGFTNEIDRALESFINLDSNAIDQNRTELELKLNSILDTLVVEIKSEKKLRETSKYIQKAHQFIDHAQKCKLSINKHQMDSLTFAIQIHDACIAMELYKLTKSALQLRKINKQAREQIHNEVAKTYITTYETELSDDEYEDPYSIGNIFKKLPKDCLEGI
jgi:hypothetical protein